MKTSKLKNIAWVFFALVLTATTVQAQGRGNGNKNVQNKNATCLEQITDLNEAQKTQILKLMENHQKEIDELRNNRRATVDDTEKDEIRSEMLERVAAHQTEVKNLLSADQQKEYELLHARGTNFRNQQFARGNRIGYKGNAARFNKENRNNYRANNRACRGNSNRGNYGNRQRNRTL